MFRTKIQILLLLNVMVLVGIGILMIYSSSYSYAYQNYSKSYYFMMRQGCWFLIGLLAMISMMHIDYSLWRKLHWLWFGLAVILLLLVFVPGIGLKVKGSTRWIHWGPLRFQPSEIAKLAMIISSAAILSKAHAFRGGLRNLLRDPQTRNDCLRDIWQLGKLMLVTVVFMALIYKENDLGGTMMIWLIASIIWFASSYMLSPFIGLWAVSLAAGLYAVTHVSRFWERIVIYINPYQDPYGAGHQTIRSLMAVAKGGLLGRGLAGGEIAIPESHNDFIFAIICEEFGLIFTTVLLSLFVSFVVLGAIIAWKKEDQFGRLLATGIVGAIAVQALINFMVVLKVIPITGMTLPFISYGGSSLLINMLAIGILINIAGNFGLEENRRKPRNALLSWRRIKNYFRDYLDEQRA